MLNAQCKNNDYNKSTHLAEIKGSMVKSHFMQYYSRSCRICTVNNTVAEDGMLRNAKRNQV